MTNIPHDVTIRIYTLIGRFSSSFASFKLGRSLALCFRTFDATTPAIFTFFKSTQSQNDLCPRAEVIEDKNHPPQSSLFSREHSKLSKLKYRVIQGYDPLPIPFHFLSLHKVKMSFRIMECFRIISAFLILTLSLTLTKLPKLYSSLSNISG